jgi:hypothetical protein
MSLLQRMNLPIWKKAKNQNHRIRFGRAPGNIRRKLLAWMNTAAKGAFRVQAISASSGWRCNKHTQKLTEHGACSQQSSGAGRKFETLSREKGYLVAALGVPMEIFSASEAGEDPKGKSKQAEPGRPAIYIE